MPPSDHGTPRPAVQERNAARCGRPCLSEIYMAHHSGWRKDRQMAWLGNGCNMAYTCSYAPASPGVWGRLTYRDGRGMSAGKKWGRKMSVG